MSFFNFSPSSQTSPPSPSTLVSSSSAEATTSTGLGYGIAIAVAILVLVSTTLLASYVCVRIVGRGTPPPPPQPVHLLPQTIVITVAPGLDDATISSYPKHSFSPSSEDDATCAICLADYRPDDVLRRVPDCRHQFHVECIDAWLRKSATCPVCRYSPAPTPVATPLSELVPLAAHGR